MHQPAGRIVDEDEQRALRPAILKPPMLAPVDLHQFTDALASATRLVDAFAALLALKPQPVGHHPLAHRLAADRDPVPLRPENHPRASCHRRNDDTTDALSSPQIG
jgi:hypothetical protein